MNGTNVKLKTLSKIQRGHVSKAYPTPGHSVRVPPVVYYLA